MKTNIHRPTYGDRRESFFSRLHTNDSSFGLTQFIMLRFSPLQIIYLLSNLNPYLWSKVQPLIMLMRTKKSKEIEREGGGM